jgi:tRNA (guanine37-N1)-methyltransferase
VCVGGALSGDIRRVMWENPAAAMRIDVLTIFPEMVRVPLGQSIIGRAISRHLVDLRVHDLRDWTTDRHRTVDDEPYGGGPGMVMKPEPFFAAVESLRTGNSRVLLMTPQGRRFEQPMARELATADHLIVLCGHYEGIDHRVVEALVADEISIGDYVLTNGAIAAVVVIDAVVRLVPGVLGDAESAVTESFSESGTIEAPAYTRPAEFRGMRVPPVLLSGNHASIAEWRREQATERTRRLRPDLLPGKSPPSPPGS